MMQDSADPMMLLWLNLPKRTESIIEHSIKNKLLEHPLNQHAMKGIAKTEDGDQVPFMCIRVHIIKNHAIDEDAHSTGILNTFRMNGRWQSSLAKGDRPSFEADGLSDQILPKVKNLYSRGNFTLPMMHIQAA
jgi:hypothetical protein